MFLCPVATKYLTVLRFLFLLTALFCIVCFAPTAPVQAQPKPQVAPYPDAPYVYGQITDEKDQPLAGVSIYESGSGNRTKTDANGNYTIYVREGITAIIEFKLPNYNKETRTVKIKEGEVREINCSMTPLNFKSLPKIINSKILSETKIVERKMVRAAAIDRLDVRNVEIAPSPTGSVEALVRTFALGAVSNNELSSTYSVRGGNFDENLVYVNDFEIYRPFLIRSGQQEGLSFINPDLVGSISFSSGGFEAKYGDKMSSVLDIKYKKPTKMAGSISASFLGLSAHIEGVGLKDSTGQPRLRYIAGARRRVNAYLFNALPVQGQYTPAASDLQTFITYQFNRRWQLQLIGNYAKNDYEFYPVSSETSFGTFNTALELQVFYDGHERDQYSTTMGGAAITYTSPRDRLTLKLMTSVYDTHEKEAFDVIGAYWIGEVEKNLGKENFGELTRVLGVGAYQDWARNELQARIYNIGHRGFWDAKPHFVSWGLNTQREQIQDKLNEWYRLDSAGYNIPLAAQFNEIRFADVLKSSANLQSNRLTGFVQDEWRVTQNGVLAVTAGVRFNYWDLNQELLLSPRVQIAVHPQLKRITDTTQAVQSDLVLRLAGGAYHQPAFFREMRSPEGVVNTQLNAQRSYQVVLGADYTFNLFHRPFRWTTEVYYKKLQNIVSYDFDNLLIRYSGQNDATGYAAGIDTRLFGEFVQGVDSWLGISVMQVKEDLADDHYFRYFNSSGQEIIIGIPIEDNIATDSSRIEVGSVPRPTDQRVSFNLFFQDYLPRNKNFKAHLLLSVGTGFPFSPPDDPKNRGSFRIPPYRRVDLGFSAMLFDKAKRELPSRSIWRHFQTAWASIEIFNVLGVQNTIAYNWIDAISSESGQNIQYAVPNYLSSRRVNLKLLFKF